MAPTGTLAPVMIGIIKIKIKIRLGQESWLRILVSMQSAPQELIVQVKKMTNIMMRMMMNWQWWWWWRWREMWVNWGPDSHGRRGRITPRGVSEVWSTWKWHWWWWWWWWRWWYRVWSLIQQKMASLMAMMADMMAKIMTMNTNPNTDKSTVKNASTNTNSI